jgi:lysophospholipase L1-like esterase
MKRLVYSPSVNVWVKSDSGIFDLSPYVTGFQIDRRIGEVSNAQVTFRNPRITDERNPKKTRFMFTEHIADDGTVRPMFHPMDPIIITLTRLKGRPIQVFTGYCDTTPYVQLLPGEVTLDASCTIKRLQHTYWDPALIFVRDFMSSFGWGIDASGIAVNPKAENSKNDLKDSSFGNLLFGVLTEVGGWDPKNIYIQELPGSQISKIVVNLYKDTADEAKESMKDLQDFLYSLVGASKYGSAGGGGGGGGGGFSGSVTLIGDSITVLSKDQIKDKIPNVSIFAQTSKHLNQDGGQEQAIGQGADQKSGLKILEAQKDHLGDAVVIALGTNDIGTPKSQFAGWIDKAMEKIGSSKPVVWVNTYVTNGNYQAINQAISEATNRHSNLTVADWKTKAKLGPDGTHPTTQGSKIFAQVIADALGIQEGGSVNSASGQVLGKPIVTKDNFQGSNINWTFTGKGSQFGSSHRHHITDPGDNSYGSQPPASGADPDVPGFAARKDIGHTPNFNWFVVVSPNGRAAALPQTDWGPNASVGRAIDVNTAAAIEVFGYSKSGNSVNFPTDQGTWKLYFAGTGDNGRAKAEHIVRTGRV